MDDDKTGKQDQSPAIDEKSNPGAAIQAEVGSAQGVNPKGASDSSGPTGQDNKQPTANLLHRLTINECLTLFVALGSLAVAVLTFVNSLDTSDIKGAVSNLSTLATQASRQADAVQGQLTEMRAEQRPWLAVKVTMTQDLQIEDKYLRSGVAITIKNVGHTPAFAVEATAPQGYFYYSGHHNWTELEHRYCADSPRFWEIAKEVEGQTYFPGEEKDWAMGGMGAGGSYGIGISSQDIAAAVRASGNVLDLWVYGCVDYQFGNPPTHHQTGYIYRLGWVHKVNGTLVLDQLRPGALIPRDEIRMTESPSTVN
ncbi:MAG TPA: hypothetical protein VII56_06660 [Rhizomicrobium sp.]